MAKAHAPPIHGSQTIASPTTPAAQTTFRTFNPLTGHVTAVKAHRCPPGPTPEGNYLVIPQDLSKPRPNFLEWGLLDELSYEDLEDAPQFSGDLFEAFEQVDGGAPYD